MNEINETEKYTKEQFYPVGSGNRSQLPPFIETEACKSLS